MDRFRLSAVTIFPLLCVLCASVLVLPAQEKGDKPERGTLQAVMVDKGPALDGTLKDPLWQKCPPLELGECTTEKPGAFKTTARALFAPANLYVAFECAQSETGKIRANVKDRDGEVWNDDCVEVFVTGDRRVGYFHVVVNPLGTLMDAAMKAPAFKDDMSWNSTATAKVAVEKGKGWTATISIPLKEIGAYVGENQTWSLNLNRTVPSDNPAAPTAEISWAVMRSSDYHRVRDYGVVNGVKVPRRDEGVTREAAAPPPAPQTDKGKVVGGVTVYKQFPEISIPAGKEGTAKTIDLDVAGSKGLKLAFLARANGEGVTAVPLNMGDKVSNDNTTPKSYALAGPEWSVVLYRCDRFRYNGQPESTVGGDTEYTNICFHGNNGAKGTLELREVCLYRGEDASPPTAPEDLAAKADDNGVQLTWKPATDNVGVATYVVSRAASDGKFVKVAEVHLPGYLDKPQTAGEFKYRVLAVDFQDNCGPWSKETSAKAPKGFAAGTEPPEAKDRPGYAETVRRVHKAGAGKVRQGVVFMYGDSITNATIWPLEAFSTLGRYDVIAHGYPSMQTGFGKDNIEKELKATNPEYCLLMYGTNDGKGPDGIRAGVENLLAINKACAENGTVCVIATIPPRGYTDPQSKPEAAFNEALAKACRENHIPVAYVFDAFLIAGDSKKTLADGVHPSPAGTAAAAKAWAAAMRQVEFVLLDR